MDTIKTSSGKIYECVFLSELDNPCTLYIRVTNSTLPEVATTFGDKEETKELLYGDTLLIGYTKLLAIVIEGNIIRVALTRE